MGRGRNKTGKFHPILEHSGLFDLLAFLVPSNLIPLKPREFHRQRMLFRVRRDPPIVLLSTPPSASAELPLAEYRRESITAALNGYTILFDYLRIKRTRKRSGNTASRYTPDASSNRLLLLPLNDLRTWSTTRGSVDSLITPLLNVCRA